MSLSRKNSAGPHGPLLLPSRAEQNARPSAGHFPDHATDRAADRSSERLGRLRASPAILRFGPFEVNCERRELRKHGMKIRLEEKPFDILEALLREPGKLVTRDALRAKLWPDTFVSFEHCLNTAVNKLREAVGDSAHFFRFIETVRGRGYRFIGRLESESPADARPAVLLMLPFRTHDANRAVDSFAAGLTDELSARFGQLDSAQLALVPASVALLYARAESSAKEVTQNAGADLVLEGSIRHAAGRVRVTLQLARAGSSLGQIPDQLCIWSGIYERPISPPFVHQAEIAQLVVSSIASEFGLESSRAFPQPHPPALALQHSRMQKLGS
jgi:DNA-binding winged helix-turn-helix (wHTH) protein